MYIMNLLFELDSLEREFEDTQLRLNIDLNHMINA
jgi:hypothetical protein